MKNMLLRFALAASSIMPAVVMAADSTAGSDGFFVNGNLGRSHPDRQATYDDSDTGYGVNVGYRWALNPRFALGVEGGYANLGSFDPRSDDAGLPVSRAKVDGWNLGVNGRFNLSPNWYVSARGGLFRADVKGSYFGPDLQVVDVDATSNKHYAGAGFGYDFSNNLSVGLNYDYYKVDKNGLSLQPNLVSVSGEYRFK
jgi:opacity protein-like surface antigen